MWGGPGTVSGQAGTCATPGPIRGDRGAPGPALQDELAEGPCSLWFLSQVIEATIERHKQNSQTFKAFSGSFSQEGDPSLPPDSPVSTGALGSREGPGEDVPQAPCRKAGISEESWSPHAPVPRTRGWQAGIAPCLSFAEHQHGGQASRGAGRKNGPA